MISEKEFSKREQSAGPHQNYGEEEKRIMVHRRVRQNNNVEKLRTVTMKPLHGYGGENWDILASFNKTI